MAPIRTCRICMDTKCESRITFDTNSKWASLFEYCFGISVVTTSQAPKVLCKICSDKIIDYADFKKKCLKTDALWKQMSITDNTHNRLAQLNPVSEISEDDNYMETEYLSDSFADSEIDPIDTKQNETSFIESQIDPIDMKPNKTNIPVKNETEATGTRRSTRVKKKPLKYEPKIPAQKDNRIKNSNVFISTGVTSKELKYHPNIELKPNMCVLPGAISTKCNGKPVNIMIFDESKQKYVLKNNKMHVTKNVKKTLPSANHNDVKHNRTGRYMKTEKKKVQTVNRKTIRKLLTKWANDQKQNRSELYTSATDTTLTSESSFANAKKVKVVFLGDTNDVSPPVVSKTDSKECVETNKKAAYVDEDIVEKSSDNEEKLDNKDPDYEPEQSEVFGREMPLLFTVPDREMPPDEIETGNNTTVAEKLPKSSKLYCGICQFDSEELVAVQQHWQLHVSKNHLTCRLCEYLGGDMADMAAHRYKHHPSEFKHTVYCTICTKTFHSSTEKLEFHYRKVHLGKPGGICSYCGKEFNGFKNLRHHELAHVAPFKCYHCDRGFVFKSSLKVHLSLVFGDATHVCDVCGKKFHRKSHFNAHKETHLDLQLPCEHCDKTFATISKLKHHMRILNGKNHICDTCGKAYYDENQLKDHLNWHKNIKPYACTLCPKRFTYRSNMNEHLVRHSGIKRHECQYCKKTFLRSSTMRRHEKMHVGVKCSYEICDQTFQTKKLMKEHYDNEHNIDMPIC